MGGKWDIDIEFNEGKNGLALENIDNMMLMGLIFFHFVIKIIGKCYC